MADNIVPINAAPSTGQSPFDSIRRFDEHGQECWYGRELMPFLGYVQWRRFEDAINRAMLSCQNSEHAVEAHFEFLPASARITSGAGRLGDNYRLSRHACHLIVMAGDPRKPEIAAGQAYFSLKIREAEVVIPAQNSRIEELKLEIELQKIKNQDPAAIALLTSMHGPEVAMMLTGKSDRLLETEKPTIEVIDETVGRRFHGQTLKQVADYLAKRTGRKFKSGADIKRALERANKEYLIGVASRKVDAEYIPAEHLQEVYDIIGALDRQRLIGE